MIRPLKVVPKEQSNLLLINFWKASLLWQEDINLSLSPMIDVTKSQISRTSFVKQLLYQQISRTIIVYWPYYQRYINRRRKKKRGNEDLRNLKKNHPHGRINNYLRDIIVKSSYTKREKKKLKKRITLKLHCYICLLLHEEKKKKERYSETLKRKKNYSQSFIDI